MDVKISAYEYFAKGVAGRKSCLSFFGREFSGEETLGRIGGMADFLRERGVTRGSVVAINLPNIPECIFTIYAVNALGAVAFVTHPLLPAEALADSVREAGASLLVCLSSLKEDMGVPKVLCDGVGFLPPVKRFFAKMRAQRAADGDIYPYDRLSAGEIKPAGQPEDVAFYLPSGGTTGEPKIIRVTNRAINENAEATLSLAKVDLTRYSVLLALPFFHGFGLSSSLHGAVSGGARGVIFPFFSAKRIAKCVRKGEVNIILGVPNMYRKLLAEKDFRKGIKNMCLAFSGGDTLPEKLKRDYDESASAAGVSTRLYQGYGLAETVSVCVANSFGEDKIGTIGKPVNAQVKILRPDGAACEIGEIGEIAVSTPCMMKGYLGQEDFDGEYLLTGDLGFVDEEGYIRFSGRKKRIIVIGGLNVYPLEIERAAMELSFVKEAAAVEYSENGKPKIALFISDNSEENEEIKSEKLRAHLKRRLIRYALPAKIRYLAALPRTDLGKIDVNALKESV